ncbi:hypothetical protein [Oceanobacillus saliphilus]|uniref:hypothetical protein n=1 Tax=Oceanobacillus saliphilus TaxID=2925834 RepID=UPI00201E0F57|nr:hypothetical protein [Oceanobacillus saliphilus]
MLIEPPKQGLLYTQRTIQPVENIINTEERIKRFLILSDIEIVKKFSDIGYANLMRPGLNELLKFIANTEQKIDTIVFYSFDLSGKDRRRIDFVLPRIKKTVENVMWIKNYPNRSRLYEEEFKEVN